MRCPGWPCDTPHAINPAIWRLESEKLKVDVLVDRIQEEGVQNVCLTGGEPFMQNSADLYELVSSLTGTGHKVEVFTNGSYLFPDWALEQMLFMMDWKLEGSGEAKTNRPIRFHNAAMLKRTDGIKFVVTDEDDLKEAMSISVILQNEGCLAQLWIGAAWGRIKERVLVDFLLENRPPWRLNTQTHKHIWPADARRT